MRTYTIRLEDDTCDLLNHLAQERDQRPSDVIRAAVARGLTIAALNDPEFAKLFTEARGITPEQSAKMLGIEPDGPDMGVTANLPPQPVGPNIGSIALQPPEPTS